MAKKNTFELLVGKAPGLPEGSFEAGDTFESDKPYDEMWPNKFAKVSGEKLKGSKAENHVKNVKAKAAKAKAAEVEEEDVVEEEEADTKEDVKPQAKAEDGEEDVTDDFPVAKKNGLKVTFVKKKGFTVFDEGEKVNKTPIKSQDKVEPAIKKYFEDME